MWIASESGHGNQRESSQLQRERALKWSAVIHSEGNRCNRQAHDEVSELRYNTLLSIGQQTSILIRQHWQMPRRPVSNGRANEEEVGDAGLALAAGHDKSKTFRW
ncbi:hypothetical protein M441DRAFT_74265 [Trichoderma asperellum CBS 433.97]|uniref:Uncharacterized protein n=1 Tax=Trichoderma asperellum (strain ATCC 204424 / CBS 433.97 / NBRC 101777) TaxID=1042311 RepID=A0A2T3YSK4_TRIA4|nr:hypothetical protein M441DRAFT_74265 [Trichoderma asperellum CBS 433.97]PTB35517.1 hypothetical protein M441DRAFT_74265 [Trichoderma asperellum CBS 433.97]